MDYHTVGKVNELPQHIELWWNVKLQEKKTEEFYIKYTSAV